jgi:hypothetical protein
VGRSRRQALVPVQRHAGADTQQTRTKVRFKAWATMLACAVRPPRHCIGLDLNPAGFGAAAGTTALRRRVVPAAEFAAIASAAVAYPRGTRYRCEQWKVGVQRSGGCCHLCRTATGAPSCRKTRRHVGAQYKSDVGHSVMSCVAPFFKDAWRCERPPNHGSARRIA